MVIFFITGDFWIETIEFPNLALGDPAGQITSPAVNLEKGGHFCGGTISPGFINNSANGQAVSTVELRDGGGGSLQIGEEITSITMRVTKQAGVGGDDIAAKAVVFMRK